MRKIVCTLGTLDKAIKELQEYKKWVERKTSELIKRLAEIGQETARIRFAGAVYDGLNDSNVSISPSENGWTITAQGRAVCFIEYGAGVTYNSTSDYPNPRPAGIVGIGEYGKGKGKLPEWGYYDEDGELVITKGNKAAMPLYHATVAMQQKIETIAKEVFSTL